MGIDTNVVKKNGNGTLKMALPTAIAVFGAAMVFFFIPYSNLSGDVRANTERIKGQEKALQRIENKIDSMDIRFEKKFEKMNDKLDADNGEIVNEAYENMLRAQNFKLALQNMKAAAAHLEEAGEEELSHELKVLGGRVVSKMYAKLPKELIKDIRQDG